MTDQHTTAVAIVERQPLPERMHPMVRAMMAGNPDPTTLRELLAVQREWEAGEAKREYTRALVELKAAMPTVINRDKEVAFGNTHYTHASLGNIIGQITPHLAAHGFSVSWSPSTAGKDVTVVCRLTHSGGHSEETRPITAPLDNKGSKSEPQGVASTITLLQRYSLMALLGLATADMDEPTGELMPDLSRVDAAANLKMCAALAKRGVMKDEAQAHVGRAVSDWTAADLDTLRGWRTETARRQAMQDRSPAGASRPGPAPAAGEPSPALAEVLKCIGIAANKKELDLVAEAAKKLSDAEKAIAKEAFKKRGDEIAMSTNKQPARREPGADG